MHHSLRGLNRGVFVNCDLSPLPREGNTENVDDVSGGEGQGEVDCFKVAI